MSPSVSGNAWGQPDGASDVDFNVNPVIGGPTVHPFLWEHGKMLDLVAGAPPGMFGGTFGIAAWLNDSEVALTLIVLDDTTFNVTGNICGLLATLAGVVAVIVTVPV